MTGRALNFRNHRQIGVFACVIAPLAVMLFGCEAGGLRPTKEFLQAKPVDMEWFKEAKFGMFVHWGPISIKGTEIGWSRGAERRGRKGQGAIPAEVYDNLYKQFNPTEFNADEWIATAQAAGMKYFVFTSKHHDGFSMFDTKLSDYKITNSPFNRDVCKELADACHKAGMKIGWYYSPVDWHHPDYRTANHRKYIAYMHGQLRELCTNYGKIDMIWFDGLGGTAKDWDSEKLFRMLRTLQPGVLLNNRAGLPADFDTPEQEIGSMKDGRPWETCMTIGDQWAYKPDDRIKSLQECLHAMALCSGGGGNFLFNVGPRPDGRIEPLQVERIKEMGKWLHANGQSIYGTKGGPYARNYWGVSTCKGEKVYLHILGWESDQATIPPIQAKVLSASLARGETAAFQQADRGVTITVPKDKQDPVDTVVVLTLDRPAEDLKLISPASGSLAKGKKATQSGIKDNEKQKTPANAIDDNYGTFWTAHLKQPPAYLEVDLGSPMKIGSVRLCEILDRTRGFVVEARVSETGEWKKITEGTTIGQALTLRLPPTEARFVRVGLVKIDGNRPAQLAEFQIFPPGQ